MRDLRAHIDGLFAGAVQDREVQRYRELAYRALKMRYDGFRAQGMSEAASVGRAIASTPTLEAALRDAQALEDAGAGERVASEADDRAKGAQDARSLSWPVRAAAVVVLLLVLLAADLWGSGFLSHMFGGSGLDLLGWLQDMLRG